jgi:hypothetical protein
MEETDIVIPLGNGSSWKNNELRYCLRSLVNMPHRHVYLITDKVPDFVTNIEHIKAIDTEKIPDTNILKKVVKACESPKVSDPFIFMNDDHYCIDPITELPDYYNGTLEQYLRKRGARDNYGFRVLNTIKRLQRLGATTKYFDIHYPIVYDKSGFMSHVAAVYDDHKYGYVLKSLYGNGMALEGKQIQDCKSNLFPRETLPFFSSYPNISKTVKGWLEGKFPNKSVYEK